MKETNTVTRRKSEGWIIIIITIVVIAAAILAVKLIRSAKTSSSYVPTEYTVVRGDLVVSVTESGDIKALESVDIQCEVEGRTTIISIVDEGTFITPQDVKDGKILAELDSSEIKQKLTQQEITFSNAESSLTEARESLDIQIKQNNSDIKAGEMKAKFALMDLEKYVGGDAAQQLISVSEGESQIDEKLTTLIADQNSLGGEALQKMRELDSDIYLAEQNLEQAKSKLKYSIELYDKKYLSANDKEADRLDKEGKEIKFAKAKTSKDLYIKYEFLKETNKLLADYNEALRELERINAKARSKLAQAQAKLKNNEKAYGLQQEHLEKLKKQLHLCVIKAPAPGQVVYASSVGNRWERQNNPIKVGAQLRERQKIIVIPDTSIMKVEIKIHETWIDKIALAQKTKISIAAFPDLSFTGEVIKKAQLADPEEWLNPDLKVYSTDISIDGTHDFIKTGMTAKVEVIVEELTNVIIIPIQAVISSEGKKYCFLSIDQKQQQVETGAFNDDFVEIRSGLSISDKVMLNPPRISSTKKENGKPKTDKEPE